MIRYMVYYKDDFGKRHLTFVNSFTEINFIKTRFFDVTYEVCASFQRITAIKKGSVV